MVVLLSGISLAGCSTRAGWQYHPGLQHQQSANLPISLAVTRFDDQRPTDNNRYFWVCVIPLVPYCESHYARPENANGFLTEAAYNFRPESDLAEATAQELRRTGMFRDVFVTDRTVDPGTPLVLRGTITNTQWDGTRYPYLLGPYMAIPWVFGLPLGSTQNTLSLKLELAEVSSGRVLWTDQINQTYGRTEGLYYNYATDFGYPVMFGEGIKGAAASLQNFLARQPAHFWESDKASR